jgi:diguanylate cyclase (GGDEF)-like protein/PAS domain S-box-containing protein
MGEERASRRPSSPAGIFWEWDIRAGVVVVSAGLRALLGYESAPTEIPLTEWQRGIHPDDLVQTTQALFDHLARNSSGFSVRNRLRAQGGDYLEVEAAGAAERDSSGNALRVRASVRPIVADAPLQSTSRAGSLLAGAATISHALAAAPTDAHALAVACDRTVSLRLADAAWIGIAGASRRYLRTAASAGLPPDAQGHLAAALSSNGGDVGRAFRVLRDDRAEVCALASSQPNPTPLGVLAEATGWSSLIIAPVRAPDGGAGVYVTCHVSTPVPDDVVFAEHVGRLISARLSPGLSSRSTPPEIFVEAGAGPTSGNTDIEEWLVELQAEQLEPTSFLRFLARAAETIGAESVALLELVAEADPPLVMDITAEWTSPGKPDETVPTPVQPTPSDIDAWMHGPTSPEGVGAATSGPLVRSEELGERRFTAVLAPVLVGDRLAGAVTARIPDETQAPSDEQVAAFARAVRVIAVMAQRYWVERALRLRLADADRTSLSLRRSTEVLQSLNDTSAALMYRLDAQDLLPSILTNVAHLMRTDHSYIAMLTADENRVETTFGTGVYTDYVGLSNPASDGLSGEVIRKGAPISLADYEEYARRTRSLPKGAIGAAVAAPLRAHGRVVGVIGVAHTEKERLFDDQDVDVLRRYSEIASIALENAQLHGSIQQELVDRRRVEQELRDSEERWQLALQGSSDGLWDWNLRTAEVSFSERWRQMLGYSLGDVEPHFENYVRLVHPDDLPSLLQGLYGHLARQTEDYQSTHRLLCRDGAYKWVNSRGRALWDEHGRAVRMVVAQTDITEQRLSQDKLLRAKRLYAALSTVNQAVMHSADRDATFATACAAVVDHHLFKLAWVGTLDDTTQTVSPVASRGGGDVAIAPVRLPTTGDQMANGPAAAAVLGNARCVVNEIRDLPTSLGWEHEARREGFRSAASFPIIVADRPVGAFTVYSDQIGFFGDDELGLLGELTTSLGFAIQTSNDEILRQRAEEELRFISYHDPLTGLHNRAYFEEEMRRLEGSRLYPITIVSTDINGLKVINDSMGHRRGDEFLIEYARLLKSAFRTSDVVARLGGDEFAIVLQNTDEATAANLIRRLRERIDAHNAQGETLPISHALGTATFLTAGESLEQLYKLADRAMYIDKTKLSADSGQVIVRAMIAALATKDFGAEGHVARVKVIAATIGETLGLSLHDLSDLDLLAEIHDLGKIGVPDSVLFKPGPLSADERELVKQHSAIGYRIAKVSTELAHIAELILYHQEWWNGEGYPTGINGPDIPITCRVFAVADAYDAMTSPRPHRPAMPHESALKEIQSLSGIQFDPTVVDQFVSIATGF